MRAGALATRRVLLLASPRPHRRILATRRATSAAMPSAADTAAAPSPAQAVVAGLEPAKLWRHFASLSEIPRPSKQEGR